MLSFLRRYRQQVIVVLLILLGLWFWRWRSISTGVTHSDESDQVRATDSGQHAAQPSTPLGTYCNVLANIDDGEEGKVPGDYKLRGALVITRHGARNPILLMPEPHHVRSCRSETLTSNSLTSLLQSYKNLVKETGVPKFKEKIVEQFEEFPGFAEKTECVSGGMTPAGLAQMIQLGKYLRQRYVVTDQGESAVNFYPATTNMERTYQSALAFLYGLVTEKKWSETKLRVHESHHFCHDPECEQCLDKIKQLSKMFYANVLGLADAMLESTPGLMAYEFLEKSFRGLIDKSRESRYDPIRIFDTGVAFVCADEPLPCSRGSGKCPTEAQLLKVENLIANQLRRSYREESGQQVMALMSLPLLEQVSQMTKNAKTDDPLAIHYFSGHDTTMVPMLGALGVFDGHIPPYASHLIFEVYRQKAGGKLYLRILYNGEDMGNSISFCDKTVSADITLCTVDAFESFRQTEMLNNAKISDLGSFCSDLEDSTA